MPAADMVFHHIRYPATLAVIAAAALPSLLAWNLSPSPTFLNQALAIGLWAAWVLVAGAAYPGRGARPLGLALVLLMGAAAWSWGAGGLPASLALSAIGLLFAAGVLAAGGSAAGRHAQALRWFEWFCWAWVLAALLNVGVALVQVFAPDWADGDWIARSGIPGRAVGNLRQPNHLSSLLLWGAIAAVALAEMGRLGRRWAAALLALMMLALVLTASRTGLLSVALLALWGLFDKRLTRGTRALLLATPLLYALAWLGMAQWAALSAHSFGGAARLAETDISGSRFGIWSNTWALIRANPWFGVGFGEFNFAWTLTPFPGRPVAFFDHTHNLPLQLMVELGLPLAALVLGLFLWALWRPARQAWGESDNAGAARRSALMMVLMIGLHSLLEYPLWYAYFLLPAAWAWGFALAEPAPASGATSVAPASPPRSAAQHHGLSIAAALVLLGAVASVWDYHRVSLIFTAAEGAAPLAQRIEDGQKSVLFSHHADYAAVTAGLPPRNAQAAFDGATHYLLDTRLMMAWSRALAARGEVDAARYLAQRLREFRKPDASEFFAPCGASSAPAAEGETLASAAGESGSGSGSGAGAVVANAGPASAAVRSAAPPAAAAASAADAFQCQAPQQAHGWREFLPR